MIKKILIVVLVLIFGFSTMMSWTVKAEGFCDKNNQKKEIVQFNKENAGKDNLLDNLQEQQQNNQINLKSNEEIAQEVIYGLWGLGEERFKLLQEAGYDPYVIQTTIESLLSTQAATNYNYSYDYANDYLQYVNTSDVAAQIAATAWNYVGWLPYVYGGADLNWGCDCSGFTMSLYALYGYSLGRTVWQQASQGISVPVSNIYPGDIVVYYGHVGIYVGDGLVIHSPQEGECVKASNLYMMDIYDVRRMIY